MSGRKKLPRALDVKLHGEKVGTIVNLGGKYRFDFDEGHFDNAERNVLSLSYLDTDGTPLVEARRSARLPPFFANLLPEGMLRTHLARAFGIPEANEFALIAKLGADMSGAVTVIPADDEIETIDREVDDVRTERDRLKFSLAGVQLKFSAVENTRGGLTIPLEGTGGRWIVKVPSPHHLNVAENEFAMMHLCAAVGIETPDVKLVDTEKVEGLPDRIIENTSYCYAIRRFDRLDDGASVHMEDFAQVFGLYPEKKYEEAGYATVAAAIGSHSGSSDESVEVFRRVLFSGFVGNGDAHLKNWSVLYPDGRNGILSPAYDFVSTVPYLSEDNHALNFSGSKILGKITLRQIEKFANLTETPVERLFLVLEEMVETVPAAWHDLEARGRLAEKVDEVIGVHISGMARSAEEVLLVRNAHTNTRRR